MSVIKGGPHYETALYSIPPLCTMSVIKGGSHHETALYSIPPRPCPKKNPQARTTKNAKNTVVVV